MITIQYLEPGPHLSEISPDLVSSKLMACFDLLPIDCVLLGWAIPPDLEEVCRKVTTDQGAKLYRWHPLLTGDGIIYPERRWRTRNINRQPLAGFRDLPEFTFVCPNNPEVRSTILEHIKRIIQSGKYDGFFLDRMRYPSPANNPVNSLTCFCEFCTKAAGEIDLDLEKIRQSILDMDEVKLFRALFGEPIQPLSSFLVFRKHTISKFVEEIVNTIRLADLEVGLDTFSPSLTYMVGQDLSRLVPHADWTKIMIYGHAHGPATLPYELSELASWFSGILGMDQLNILTEITSLPFSDSLENFEISPSILADEYKKGLRMVSNKKLLAGIELVEIPGISELNKSQIKSDLKSIKAAGADGLSISWDLWWIPLERLELVQSVWFT